jgi:DNA-binding beta-propeller fold protein YncE
MAVDLDGDVVVADREAFGDSITAHGGLIRVDKVTGKHTALFSTGLDSPSRVAVVPGGDLVVVDGGRILRITAAGEQTELLGPAPAASEGLIETPRGLTVVNAQTTLIVDSGAAARDQGLIILRLAPAVGRAVNAPGLHRPAAVAQTDDGTILVVDRTAGGGALFRVRLGEGSPVALTPTGALQDPVGVAQAPDGRIYVVDMLAGGSGAVLEVNGSTGEVTVLSSGDAFRRPFAIAVVP